MILPQLLWRFARHRDDAGFYSMQAEDAIRWLEAGGVTPRVGADTAVDLGCGHGTFGKALAGRGWKVTFADASNQLGAGARGAEFREIDLDRDEYRGWGRYDLVVCSNVLEHLARGERFVKGAGEFVKPGGVLYLSWTNWLSPWGGHEFAPFHYLGPKWGPRVYDRWVGRKRFHTPGENLFPTWIGGVLGWIREEGGWEVVRVAPRYYTELAFLMSIPGVREFAAWNCAIHLRRRVEGGHASA